MTVIVDAMGGDHAPAEVVEGTIRAARALGPGVELVLVGDREQLGRFEIPQELPIRVEHAASVIGMNEHPARAIRRKKDSSIVVAAEFARSHPGSALVSAGSTGAVLAAGLMIIGRIEGVDRPAVATLMPTLEGSCIVLDVGGNVDCKPNHLVQFATLGAIYAGSVLGIEKPRVGLLNIGEEEKKGNELSQQTHQALSEGDLDFVGNVEPHTLFFGKADVVVADGFAGNILLKTSEGISRVFHKLIADTLAEAPEHKEHFAGLFRRLARFDSKNPEYAGAPLLGVREACIICHGEARAATIEAAIALAHRYGSSDSLAAMKRSFVPAKG